MNKKYLAYAIPLVGAIIFGGCAPKRELAKIPTEKRYAANDVSVDYVENRGKSYKTLREINRSHTAGVAAAKTGMFLLGIVSMVTVGVPILTDGSEGQGFSKEGLIGSEIKDAKDTSVLNSPVDDIKEIVANDIREKMKKNPILANTKYEYPLEVKSLGNTWKLMYENLSGDQNKSYTLDSYMTVGRNLVLKNSADSNASRVTSVDETCIYKSKPIAYDSWKANDYQLIKETKKTIVDECVKKLRLAYDKMLPVSPASSATKKK